MKICGRIAVEKRQGKIIIRDDTAFTEQIISFFRINNNANPQSVFAVGLVFKMERKW
ncbi:hypothetical protein ACFOG5_19170 [Pedobacter fastidiosus]|uniref:hypothetical protein n=1 Tax=Pedobacter fastidiosus TaxID=2765361 RepID=UPI00360940B4